MGKRTCTIDECERAHLARGMCSSHYGDWHRKTHGRNDQTFTKTCIMCDAEWVTRRREAKYCSVQCKGRAYKRTVSSALVTVDDGMCLLPDSHPVMRLRRRHRPHRSQPYLNIITAGACAWCTNTFCALTASGIARYCSRGCSKAASRAAHRQVRGQFSISLTRRLAIYRRDEWVCQLCREGVDANLVGTGDDWAPSLDHIECQAWALIPDHSDENLRLAHRWCNAVRGDERWHADLFAA
jgi:hypothetical protein